MKEMVKCMDSLSSQQTRLVVIVDGLDSCEQDKVLLVLDTVHMLFSDANTPFIVILAIDPHVIAKVGFFIGFVLVYFLRFIDQHFYFVYIYLVFCFANKRKLVQY